MKKTVIFLMVLVLLACAAVPALAAEDQPSRLQDELNLLTYHEKLEVESALDEVSDRYDMDVVIITTTYSGDRDLLDVTKSRYISSGYQKDGVILLINMYDQSWAIQPMGRARKAFTEVGRNYIGDKVEPKLSDGEYGEALLRFAQLSDQFMAQASTGEPYDLWNLPKDPYPVWVWLAVSLVVGLVVALLTTGIMKAKLRSVRAKNQASDYVRPGSMQVNVSRDIYLYRNVTRIPIPKSSGGRGSKGRVSIGGGTRGRF